MLIPTGQTPPDLQQMISDDLLSAGQGSEANVRLNFSTVSRLLLLPPSFSEGCPQLEQLNISWCDQVTKDGVQALVRSCPGLKGLFLKGCTQVRRGENLDKGLLCRQHNGELLCRLPQGVCGASTPH